MITKEVIEERKKTLETDIETVRGRLVELDNQKNENTALLQALQGAVQQCNDFLKRIDDESSDVENNES
jgi:chromosome segregation ATPase